MLGFHLDKIQLPDLTVYICFIAESGLRNSLCLTKLINIEFHLVLFIEFKLSFGFFNF